jgi:acetyl-CoA C-acetyltransferase
VGEHWDKSLRELAVASVRAALADAGREKADALYVGNMLAGAVTRQEHLGALIADFAGLRGIEAVAVETACGSGGGALRIGYQAVASGIHQTVIVCGVEKMTDSINCATTAALAMAADADFEVSQGVSFVAINALLMQRYMYEYGLKHEDFAPFAINAHRNALNNPNAMFHFPLTTEQFDSARMIADPINLLDSSPIADGSASVILCPTEMAKGRGIRIRGSAIATDSVALHDRHELLFLQAAHDSAQRAYAQAGVTPGDIDLFELHDAFTIMSALSLEASGFAERGQAVRLAQEGNIGLEGRIPISIMGGLKGRGHPVGATGVYQIVELVQQLRGEAGDNQVDCRLGMAQNIGGSGATVTTHILEAPD